MVARDLEPYLLQPNKHYWIVGPTYDLAEKEFRVIWRDMIIGLKLGKDPGIDKVYNKRGGTMFINFKRWNTLLEVKSAQNPENLVGESLDKVIMSEAAKHTKETRDRYIRPALGDRRGGADFVTTPEGFNWLYDEWMHGQDPSFIDYDSWKFPSWMNTVIFPGGEQDPEIQLLRRTMSPSAFTQEIGADFGSSPWSSKTGASRSATCSATSAMTVVNVPPDTAVGDWWDRRRKPSALDSM